MLGFMKAADYDIEGLSGTESNEDSAEDTIFVTPTAQYSGDLTADPNHHFADVTQQLYGSDAPAPGQRPDMSGFVKNYQTVTLRPWWKDAFCQQGNDLHCSLGTFAVSGLVTTSYTGSQSVVPFYLQPTLGGTDVAGMDTLRGLVDYMLRAPNRILLQAQFDKPVAGPLGLYAFFDAGQVEPTPGQLSLGNLRTDVGIGASLSVQHKVVVRLYIGFGAGEGSHPNAKLPSSF